MSPASVKNWTVYVDDNWHSMDEGERFINGVYRTHAAAVEACKSIVDQSLKTIEGRTADELYAAYVIGGDDPFILGPAREPPFSSREYAKQRCIAIAAARKKRNV